VTDCEFVRLACRPETISALAARLERFGVVAGEPEWLVSAVWLRAGGSDYLATSATNVLSDGFIARSLVIDEIDEFVAKVRSDVAEIGDRLTERRSAAVLPEPSSPPSPDGLRSRPEGAYSTTILVRVTARAAAIHRIACGLLFGFEAMRLLVATDVGTLAMVFSSEAALIDRYLGDCEQVEAADYLKRYGR
jgi:hypothetical protein